MWKILAFFFILSFIDSKAEKYYDNNNKPKVDTFFYYYKILDSLSLNHPYDTSALCIKAVRYMERTTGIIAKADGNYIGWRYFTRKDLLLWKKSYEKKQLRIGDLLKNS